MIGLETEERGFPFLCEFSQAEGASNTVFRRLPCILLFLSRKHEPTESLLHFPLQP